MKQPNKQTRVKWDKEKWNIAGKDRTSSMTFSSSVPFSVNKLVTFSLEKLFYCKKICSDRYSSYHT